MAEEKRNDNPEKLAKAPEILAGILKEHEQKDLEARIVDTMKSL